MLNVSIYSSLLSSSLSISLEHEDDDEDTKKERTSNDLTIEDEEVRLYYSKRYR